MNHSSVPNIPGIQINSTDWLKEKVAKLLELKSYKFPGAQPISFGKAQLNEIKNEDYYVAEKSDGVRCLALLSRSKDKSPEVYLFDRKNNFHLVKDMYFPIPQDPQFKKCHENTILDGEFVLDKEDDGTLQLKFLLFDCLVVGGRSLVSRDLSKRLGYLKKEIIQPYRRMLHDKPYIKNQLPFLADFKEQLETYKLDVVFNQIMPNLRHGNDGLIFTSVNSPYLLGTSNKIIKWKPANENSVDFKVQLHFVPSTTISNVPDYTKKPQIELLAWEGGNDHSKFSELGITDEEWFNTFGKNPRKFNGRIIECNYDVDLQQKNGLVSPWRFMRFRDDKPYANHIKVIRSVLLSIGDGVTKEELIDNIGEIRNQWKGREGGNQEENHNNHNHHHHHHHHHNVDIPRKRKQDAIE